MDDVTKMTQISNQQDDLQAQTPQEDQKASISSVGGHKEAGPGVVKSNEALSPSTPELELPAEMKEMGAETKSEIPSFPEAVEKIGVRHAKETTPVTTQPTGVVILPMTKTQTQTILKKHKKIRDSLIWLAMLIFRQWQIAEKKGKYHK